MKKYNNYLYALIISIFYNLLLGNLKSYSYIANIGWILGVLIIPYIISMLIEAFSKREIKFDKVFMYTTLVICVISLIGNLIKNY